MGEGGDDGVCSRKRERERWCRVGVVEVDEGSKERDSGVRVVLMVLMVLVRRGASGARVVWLVSSVPVRRRPTGSGGWVTRVCLTYRTQ